MSHTELLAKHRNKYELVLTVARRAKIIKDEIARNGSVETTKPIPLAIEEIVEEERQDGDPQPFLT